MVIGILPYERRVVAMSIIKDLTVANLKLMHDHVAVQLINVCMVCVCVCVCVRARARFL